MEGKAMVVAINDHEYGKYSEKHLSIRGLNFSLQRYLMLHASGGIIESLG
jgi:hypothetical protein